jgi:DNA polymerase-4
MREFGASGAWIHDLAHGIDPRRVNPRREEKSHGLERTFEQDISDREELRLLLYEFCEEVSHDLRHRGLRGRTITLKARYWNFKTVTRSRTVELPVNIGKRIYAVARELLERIPSGPLRLLGVQVSNLTDVRTPAQASLFGALEASPTEVAEQKLERATAALDKLRARFGANTVVPGSLLSRASLRVREREGEKKRDG